MKHKLLTTITAMLITALAIAQAPQGMNYQATVRDNSGNAITNHAVGFKFNIRQGSGSGTIVYAETQTPTSDQFGGVALVIGNGTVVSGSFSAINWASGTYFNEVLLDVIGGTNYVSMGASQLMSVPYALYAKNAGSTISNAATNYTVKFNGVPITDSTINDVAIGSYVTLLLSFLTENNYMYSLYMGTNTINTIPSIYDNDAGVTTDTLTHSPVYILPSNSYQPDYLQGYISYIQTDQVNGYYYVPLTATPVNVANLYHYSSSTHHYTLISGGSAQTAMQMFPNNPTVTGFNLTLPIKVTLER